MNTLPAAATRSSNVGEAPIIEGRAARRAIKPGDPAIVLAHELLCNNIETFRTHLPAAGAAPSEVDTHQMRVASRRIRVALRLSEPMVPPGVLLHLGREMRWFARTLGELRDLDVHMNRVRRFMQNRTVQRPVDAAQELESYELALQRARSQAQNNVEIVLRSDRFGALMGALEELPGGLDPAAARRWRSYRVSDAAPAHLLAGLKRLRKRGRKMNERAPAERIHKLRLAVKRFRYQLDLFIEAYPRLRKAAKRSRGLQELLGEFQDASMSAERVREHMRGMAWDKHRAAVDTSHTETSALQELLEDELHRAAAMRGGLPLRWHRFARAVTRKRLMGALAPS